MELPETRAPGFTKERERDCALDGLPAAPYKKTERLGAHLVFIDGLGFLFAPNIRRTWAPKEQIPVLYYLYKQDRISSINVLSVSPKRKPLALYPPFRTRNLNSLYVRSSLRGMLKHLRGPIVMLWDRGTIHSRKEVKQFLFKQPRIQMEYSQAYAPELSPGRICLESG
jgi:hypothetical protein